MPTTWGRAGARWGPAVAVALGAILGIGAAIAATPSGGTSPPSKAEATKKPPPRHGDARRGQYLVSIVGCDDCHTPGGMMGQPDMSRRLSGSELGWEGPWGVSFPRNLTTDAETGIGGWSEDDIVTAIRTGTRPDGTKLAPPMPWPDFAHMTDDDAYAVAAYLKTLPAVNHAVPAKLPPGADASAFTVVKLPPPPAWDAPKGGTPPAAAPTTPAKPTK